MTPTEVCMKEKLLKEELTNHNDERDAAFKRHFKYALYAFAVVEFIMIVVAIYYKVKR
jgi:hypothetical protein